MRSATVTRRIVILVVILLTAVGFGYLLIQPVVPGPDEANRIHHTGGFSIIVPEGWEHSFTFADVSKGFDSIKSVPRKPEGSPGDYFVMRLRDAPTEAKLADSHFVREQLDGKEIWVSRGESQKRRNHTVSYAIPANGQWYQLNITRPLSEPIEQSPWLDYVRSFRVDAAAKSPTTAPAQ